MPTDFRKGALAALALTIVLAASAVPAKGPSVRWRTDWESARHEARRSGKPLLVVFRCER